MSWKFWKKDEDKKDNSSNDPQVVNNTSNDTKKDEEPKKKGFGARIKEAAMKKMMEKQLKQLPPEQREIVMKAVIENPEFFEKIAKETEAEMKKGVGQMAASMKVMRKYQSELQKIMSGVK